MKHLNVSGAILVNDGQILCAQRNTSKYEYTSLKFEFPGGKIEQGETPAQALHRELIEEMDVDIDVDSMKAFYVVEHEYPDFSITMHTFICPVSNRNVNLKEHVSCEWLSLSELDKLDWAGADLPVVNQLKERGIDEYC